MIIKKIIIQKHNVKKKLIFIRKNRKILKNKLIHINRKAKHKINKFKNKLN